MTYEHQPRVTADIAEKSKKEIDAINNWMNNLHGSVYTVKTIRYGQARPYADHVIEAIIYAYRPNVWTTNGPAPGWLTREDAIALARMTFGDFKMESGWDRYLERLSPVDDPCQAPTNGPTGKYPSWRIILKTPSTD